MRRHALPVILAWLLVAGCAAHHEGPAQPTLAELRNTAPDLQEADVGQGLEEAMEGYRRFLEETPETAMTPEAMRRLADLEIEKQFGLRAGDGQPREMAAPEPAAPSPKVSQSGSSSPFSPVAEASPWESDEDFELRTTAEDGLLAATDGFTLPDGGMNGGTQPSGPVEAIALYERLLTEYPTYEHNDKVLYQMARAYDELGRTEEALATMERLIAANPYSEHYDEVQFRRGEFFFTRRRFRDAESAYSAVIGLGAGSSYYELSLYKLGWTLYKQEFYEEALHKYMALLDYRVSIGYDFDQEHSEEDERRVADTERAISLSFSNMGGPEAVQEYFSAFGNRSYEDRVYANLGEHYLAKLRYDDAAKTYKSFVALYPFHRAAPDFGMRLVETFTQGGFPKLVLESKREFASKYGLRAEYWQHFQPEERPEVIAYLKTNLKDIATHYHAQYQEAQEESEKIASYNEALQWYREYLDSFPTDAESPAINYRLADLHLEQEDFGEAARQYERTAYDYVPHPQSAAAGYAAVYAYREQLKVAGEDQQDAVKRNTIASSLKFADTFPEHEHAPAILGAAADDLFEMKSYPEAVESAQRLIDNYPATEPEIRRSAWIVVAHGSFELADFARAEHAYGQVLAATPESDEARAGLVDNLAASIYKQGELAREAEDYRSAAEHFLRVRSAAPGSTIRPTAEYDAGSALMSAQEWASGASVLEAFRSTYPEHELHVEATRQIAFAYREDGQLSRAAEEYDRLGSESEDPDLRAEALLVAGDLYEQTDRPDGALGVYGRYVEEFPRPVETALETRFKMAEIHKAARDDWHYHLELNEIVTIDAEAGPERTGRTRTIAARSALVLAELVYGDFVTVKLLQPFDVSLKEKKQRMDTAIEAMEQLVDYEIADVTAGATYYMAETYLDFSRSLMESERPADLAPAELDEYEMVLDEEAFPFEEKAIDFHEKNLELLHAGVFNEWTENSLGRLAELMPGRYAKSEMSSGFVNATDTYVYRTPAGQPAQRMSGADEAPQADPADSTHAASATGDGGVVEHERQP